MKIVTLERIFLALAILCGAVGLYGYTVCGVNPQFDLKLAPDVLWAYGIGIALCLVSLFYSRKPLKFFGYLALLYAFVQSIAVQATYVTNVFVSIDGNSFSTDFLLMAICSLLAVILALAGTIQTAHRKEA